MLDNLNYKCTQCEGNFKSEKGLNIHIGKAHKKEELITPEKGRGNSAQEELSLTLTPTKECRKELEYSLEEVTKEPHIFQLSVQHDPNTCIKKDKEILEMVKVLAQA